MLQKSMPKRYSLRIKTRTVDDQYHGHVIPKQHLGLNWDFFMNIKCP